MIKWLPALLILMLLVGCPAGNGGGSQSAPLKPMTDDPWPMRGGNHRCNGLSKFTGPQSPRRLWKIQLTDIKQDSFNRFMSSEATVSRDGSIYIGSFRGELFAINRDGSLRWKKYVGANQLGAAAIAGEEIFLGGIETLRAFSAKDGSEVWRANGYFACEEPGLDAEGNVCALALVTEPDGSLEQIFEFRFLRKEERTLFTGKEVIAINPHAPFALAVAKDGKAYAVSNQITAISPQGELDWLQQLLPSRFTFHMCMLDQDDELYVWTLMGVGDLRKYSSSGVEEWKYRPQGWSVVAAALSPSGHIVVMCSTEGDRRTASHKTRLSTIDKDGNELWARELKQMLSGGISVDESGAFYVPSRKRGLHAFNPDGSDAWFHKFPCDTVRPSIGGPGLIYATGMDGCLYAIGE